MLHKCAPRSKTWPPISTDAALPPTSSARSKTVTAAPAAVSSRAAVSPETPPPMTATLSGRARGRGAEGIPGDGTSSDASAAEGSFPSRAAAATS